jgi:DNA ligase (NAD+)
MPDLAIRAEQLRALLIDANYRYHVLAAPTMEDVEYDRLYRELIDIETAQPHLATLDSPTRHIGATVISTGFTQASHHVPMLSLDNVFDEAELRAWDARARKLLGRTASDPDIAYVVEPKFDGLAASLLYAGTTLVRGATRGDGTTGEDITANVRAIADIPRRLRADPMAPEIEVRGEVYMTRSRLVSLNAEREAAGEAAYQNARNTAAGALRQLDSAETARRGLSFWAYQMVGYDGSTSQSESLATLERLGFPVNPNIRRVSGIEAVLGAIAEMAELRTSLDYDTDGVVIKVDSAAEQAELGFVSRSPRWATAFKFKSAQATTRLLTIDVQVGHSGAITPVARIAPVFVAGTTISNVGLHNLDDIRRKDIRVGDVVIVQRAGEVIPQIVGPVIDARDGSEYEWQLPTHCPSCGSPVEREPGVAVLFCTNTANCPAQRVERLIHFTAREGMDIEHAGDVVVATLVEAGLLSTFADFYRLTVADMAGLPRFGVKSAERLVASVALARVRPLERILWSLGIRNVGEGTARRVAAYLAIETRPEPGEDGPTWTARAIGRLRNATVDELASIDDVGRVVATSIVTYLADERTGREIMTLLDSGVSADVPVVADSAAGALSGRTVVVTGTLANFSRITVEAAIRDAGGLVGSDVSSKTNLLVVGEKAGSKLAKAQKLGIEIIDEDAFIALIGG